MIDVTLTIFVLTAMCILAIALEYRRRQRQLADVIRRLELDN